MLLSAVLKEIVLMSDQPSFDLMQLYNQNVLGGCENTRDSFKKKVRLEDVFAYEMMSSHACMDNLYVVLLNYHTDVN